MKTGNDKTVKVYEQTTTKVPVTAHELIKAAAKKHNIRICDAWVEAGMLLAKKAVK